MRYLFLIESDVLQRLHDLSQPSFFVRGLPDNPKVSGEDLQLGELTVRVDSQRAGETGTFKGHRQRVTVFVDLFLRVSTMVQKTGYYALMEAISSRLFAYTPKGSVAPLRFISSVFQDQVEGWYMYEVRWATEAILVLVEQPPVAPELRRVGFVGGVNGDSNEEFYSYDPETGRALNRQEFQE